MLPGIPSHSLRIPVFLLFVIRQLWNNVKTTNFTIIDVHFLCMLLSIGVSDDFSPSKFTFCNRWCPHNENIRLQPWKNVQIKSEKQCKTTDLNRLSTVRFLTGYTKHNLIFFAGLNIFSKSPLPKPDICDIMSKTSEFPNAPRYQPTSRKENYLCHSIPRSASPSPF